MTRQGLTARFPTKVNCRSGPTVTKRGEKKLTAGVRSVKKLTAGLPAPNVGSSHCYLLQQFPLLTLAMLLLTFW
jgi:hypothetical protein